MIELDLCNTQMSNKIIMIAPTNGSADITGTVAMSEMLQGSDSLKGFLEPALVKFEDKSYSLEPDMINGWRPRRKVYRQIPLRYLYRPVDLLTKQYTKLGASRDFRVIYMGPRYNSNLKLTKAYCCKQYDPYCKEALLYSLPKLKKFNFSYVREREKELNNQVADNRLFVGMNPTIEEEGLVFDSDFQSGNLDLVIKITQQEYDLFMRVDTNTRGHNSWFFFKVRNTRAKHSVKFNICNFHRTTSLFMSGMRPSVFSKISAKGWNHQGNNVSYTKKPLRYEVNEGKELWCLTFDYTFENDFDEVFFAYSVPYTYSYLLHFLEELSNQQESKTCLKVSYNLESPAGLIIPLLTISSPTKNPEESKSDNKKVILITGRMHPGQTQGSWTMQGLVTFLCSPEAKYLRDRIIFKIIPMVNVDGVVGGNFRTGLLGFDLNRLFRVEAKQKYYEVEYIKELAAIYKGHILMYLDFHGHSTKKNIFIYGPDYKLIDSQYLLSRVLPKTISKLTETFRYYSCIFKVSRAKEKTARAVMLREYYIPYCYTVQASAYCYTKLAIEIPFTSEMFIDSGIKIGKSLQKFVSMLVKIDVKRQEIKRQKKEAKQFREMKIQMYKEIQIIKIKKSNNERKSRKKYNTDHKSKSLNPVPLKEMSQLDELLEEIKKDEKLMDNQSEGDSDCENDEDDYTSAQQQKFLKSKKSSKKNKVQALTSALKKKDNQNDDLAISELKNPVYSVSPQNQKVIIRDLVEEERLNLISSRPHRNNDESLPQIKSSRPRRQFDSLHSQRLYSRSRGKTGNWASNAIRQPIRQQIVTHVNRLKMQTIESRRIPGPDTDQYDSKIVVKQGCVVNLKIDSDEDELIEDTSSKRLPATFQPITRKFPDVYQSLRKDQPPVCKRRKLEIVELKPQVPDIISQILKKHMNHSPGAQRKHLQRSIQIIRL